MQKKLCRLHVLLLILFSTLSYSQQSNSEKDSISKKIEDYFFLERENIHLQLNKNIFFTNEKIWLKGYVYDRKNNLPFSITTNVYATLYNEAGEKIDDKLFFSSNGSFLGDFELNESIKTGKYYIHVFTNWMKNFKEDESSYYKIQIINQNDTSYTEEEVPDYSKINIVFYPEGGKIIEGIKNIIGVNLSDCNGNALPITEGELLNPSGQVIQKIALNQFGYGKFEFIPEIKTYKARFYINNKVIEEIIPITSATGISLEVNCYGAKNKTFVKIKTNSKSIDNYIKKPLLMVVHQNDKSSIFDIDFKNNQLEQTIIFSNDNLYPGVNTIRIIDKDFNQVAERMVFKYPNDKLNLTLQNLEKLKDTLTVSGKLNTNYSTLAISILPNESISLSEEKDLYSSFLLNPYLKENAKFSRYYFNEVTPKKAFELDLILLCQESAKNKWQDIKLLPPENKHSFDVGLSLKGLVNQSISQPTKYKVNMYSFKYGVDKTSELDKNKEFYFNNLVVEDSIFLNFKLINDKNIATPFKLYPQLLNGRRVFNKPFNIEKKNCSQTLKTVNVERPKFMAGTILLDDVEIQTVSNKNKLKRSKLLGNGNLRGFKITEKDNHMDLLQFIGMNGFEVSNDPTASLQIFSKNITSMRGTRMIPLIFIDGMQLMSADMLMGIRMVEIDEIYLNPHEIVPSMKGNMGVIKIYRKKGGDPSLMKSNALSYTITKGFSKISPFKNISYQSTSDIGFQNFGLLNWIPITTNEISEFKFKIPVTDQKRVKLLIEGFASDGKLISEIRFIDLP